MQGDPLRLSEAYVDDAWEGKSSKAGGGREKVQGAMSIIVACLHAPQPAEILPHK